jgi:hypothetical protein
MEPKFEIRYFCDHTMLAEFSRKIAIGPRPPVVILCAAIYAFFVLRSWRWGILWEMLPSLAMMGVVFLVLGFMPDWITWINLRRVRKQNDNAMPETVVTLGEQIEMHEGMVHYTIEYRKLVKVIRLKHSYALMLNRRSGIILNPNGFTKGTFEEFKQFLREKRPDLKIPD